MKTDTEQIWRERVEQFRASGKSGRAFAKEHGFHETTLSRYLRQFPAAAPPVRTMRLTRVQRTALAVPVAATAGRPVEIAVGRGCVVRVASGFDEEVLRSVLRVVAEEHR